MIFRGLAVPGCQGLNQTEDLVAIWKTMGKERFQNYRATFTILDIPLVKREWINDLVEGKPFSASCPPVWKNWINKFIYTPLRTEKKKKKRSKIQQLPMSRNDNDIIKTIYNYFKGNPVEFERCAIELVRLMDKNIVRCNITRPTRDGGRDAIGEYSIGLEENSINVDFAVEAKLHDAKNPVGVKELSRLLSRLRYRQFGILVTTSYIGKQAYEEVLNDSHPVILISAVDILKILKDAGINTKSKLRHWLKKNF